jgi:hypothetical protein
MVTIVYNFHEISNNLVDASFDGPNIIHGFWGMTPEVRPLSLVQ